MEDVLDIAADHGMTWKQILATVRSSCTALSDVHSCEVCNRRKEFTSRKDIRKNRTMDTYTCKQCRREQTRRELSSDASSASSDSSEEDQHLRRHVRSIAQALSDVSDKLEGVSDKLHLITASLESSS